MLRVTGARLTRALRTGLLGSKAADSAPIVGQFLMVAQGILAVSDGVTAVHNCGAS